MDILAGDISPLIFQLSAKNEPGQLTLDREMLTIIRELDGQKTIGMVAKNLGLFQSRLVSSALPARLFQIPATIYWNAPATSG